MPHDDNAATSPPERSGASTATASEPSPPAPALSASPLQVDEVSRKWTEREEAALIAFWRANAEQYVTKTKRFFYDSAARLPALQRKSLGQIKSKCFDIEKRYRDINNALRANGAAVAPGAERDPQLRWILKKFPLYYDVHPLLREREVLANTFPVERTSSTPSPPPPAGVPSFVVPPMSGKKRALTGGAPPPVPTQPPRAPTKRPRAEIKRLAAHATEAATPSSSVASPTATETPTVGVARTPVATSVKSVAASATAAAAASAGAASSSPAPASPYFSLQVHENREVMEAAAQKLRAEAKIATIRAHATLLRERKALLDEGVSALEIDALLPLQSIL